LAAQHNTHMFVSILLHKTQQIHKQHTYVLAAQHKAHL
jgi:hypothetical protein